MPAAGIHLNPTEGNGLMALANITEAEVDAAVFTESPSSE